MENISKIAIDDSCTSMYFSFNSTTANKTVEIMESCAEISCIVSGDEDAEQNMTLEAEEDKPDDDGDHVQTVKKLPLIVSPAKSIPKYLLNAYKALSSTPTKAQLLRSVEVTRGSAAAVGISDLGLAFLEAPQESINSVLSEDKENQPQESQEIYSESSSENIVSVIEKTQEEQQKPLGKRVGFSNLPVLKGSGNTNIRGTPKVTRSMQKCEPDLISNRPSRITSKRMSIFTKGTSDPAKEFTADELPKMINSILKISKEMSLPTKRKSFANQEKPFNLMGKATRMSIVKTTLNSPARKISRKSIASVQLGRNPMRQSMVPINKRKSIAPVTVAAPRRSVMPTNTRKSMLPTTITSPKKRIIAMNSRKSVIPEKPSSPASMIPSRKTMAPKPSTSIGIAPTTATKNTTKAMKPPIGLKKEHVCEVCFRKFLVLSLFEAHRKTHSTAATSAKQTFLENDKQCRYCDKKFAIAKALSNHLIQNCTKIPPGDKKKLLFPSLAQPQQIITRMPSKSKSVSGFSSHDSLASNSTQHSQSENSDAAMPPPQNKIKKKLAHSGVYCTPNKLIPCHVCKISFSNILDYTDHSLSHSKDEAAASTATESTTQTDNIDVKSDATQTLQEDGVAPLN